MIIIITITIITIIIIISTIIIVIGTFFRHKRKMRGNLGIGQKNIPVGVP